MDLRVITPGGNQIYWGFPSDPVSGGFLVEDVHPNGIYGTWSEVVTLPSGGPTGTYEILAYDNNEGVVGQTWEANIFVDGVLVETHLGAGTNIEAIRFAWSG